MPSIDALAARGVHFQHAWSAAAWTRPGTLAMLSGERSSEIGLDTTAWVLPPGEAARYYASDPPLLPLILRKSGARDRGVREQLLHGGLRRGRRRHGLRAPDRPPLSDARHRRDRPRRARLARRRTARDRFFLFVNFNSPHEPYDPTKEMLARIPKAPGGPPSSRRCAPTWPRAPRTTPRSALLLDKIEALGLTKSTLVVVTSDHGETLSSAHDGHRPGSHADALSPRGRQLRRDDADPDRDGAARGPRGRRRGGRSRAQRGHRADRPGGRGARGRPADERSLDAAARAREARGRAARRHQRGPSIARDPVGSLAVHRARPRRASVPGARTDAIVPAPARGAPMAKKAVANRNSPDGGPPDEPVVEDELYDLVDRSRGAPQRGAPAPGRRRRLARAPRGGARERPRRGCAGARRPRGRRPRCTSVSRARGQVHRVAGTLTVGDGKHAGDRRGRTGGHRPRGAARAGDAVAPAATGAAPGSTQVIDFALATSPDARCRLRREGRPAGRADRLAALPRRRPVAARTARSRVHSACGRRRRRRGIASDEAARRGLRAGAARDRLRARPRRLLHARPAGRGAWHRRAHRRPPPPPRQPRRCSGCSSNGGTRTRALRRPRKYATRTLEEK